MLHSVPKIDLLPEHLIDQIKAGEVIERPGNLVKEILENAVDAKSTKIELHLKNNGLDLISLKDNGHGMTYKDLPLAFSRHATSKISRFEDLYRLHSFGFRGEALASIAAISKLQCISKTASTPAAEIKIEGGETVFYGERLAHSGTSGTELVIQDLFYNTPARLKFIQSQQAEKTFIKKIIYSFILTYPEIEFQIKIDDVEKEIFPVRTNRLERIQDIFPKGKESIIRTERSYENNELELYLIPASFKGPFKIQNILINNRYILDKQLHRVLTNGIQATFGEEDFHYIAYLSLPPEAIDVNVHPNKTIIKCLDISKILSLLTSTIRELAPKRNSIETKISTAVETPGSLFSALETPQTLQQERHSYNMEGFFSPHNLPLRTATDSWLWVDSFFIKKVEDKWYAFSATKLLQLYIQERLLKTATPIPLLVSEPFKSKNVSEAALEKLSLAGAEIEYLGSETLVLRGIPEWMNGFPLHDIFDRLLEGRDFKDYPINNEDWAQSTWEEMLNFFPLPDLINHKVAQNVLQLLQEKLK